MSIDKVLSICLYSPYIPDHFGGGERYLLSVAEFLSKEHRVSLAIPHDKVGIHQDVKQQYQDFFQLDLSTVNIIGTPLGTSAGFLTKLLWTKQFDVIYYLTDGGLFFSLAKKNILHIQFPFNQPKLGLVAKLKLANWQVKNTNSNFTKNVVEQSWRTKIDLVHYPFVNLQFFEPAVRKSKIILHVGRFFSHLHAKRQDVLVATFKKMCDEYPEVMEGWQLVLIGSVEDEVYAGKIASMSRGYPIKIIHAANAETLKSYYANAKIYWHATGYGVDEFLHPMAMEHFGISTLEAMASQAVPIVINKGGQKELVSHGVDGFLWNEQSGLIEKTLACISGEVDMKSIAENARASASNFNQERFNQDLAKMVGYVPLSNERTADHVSAVIPTYNGKALLKKYLPSVFTCLRHDDEVVIIDDHSDDDSVEFLLDKYDLKKVEERINFSEEVYEGQVNTNSKVVHIKLIVNKQNERFAAACNKAVNLCLHNLVFLINSDVKPHADVLEHLVPHFYRHDGNTKGVFAVGCLELEEDGNKLKRSGKHALWFERGLFVHSKAKDLTFGGTDWVTGGSGLFDKEKWQQLNGFDLRFAPAYWEDIDLSFRAKKRGWSVLFEPKALVDHKHETTNKNAFDSSEIEVVSFRNILRFTWKNGSIRQKIMFLIWLPYHLVFTSYRSNGLFLKAFFKFLFW